MQPLTRLSVAAVYTAVVLISGASCSTESDATDISSQPDASSVIDVTGTSDANSSAVSTRQARYFQIRDEQQELANLSCEGDLFPGADIDSAVLYDGPSLSQVNGYLEGCEWMPKGDACPTNSGSKSSGAEGKRDGNAFEGFASLNGGMLMCQWSDGAFLELGNVVQVIEVGPEGQLEKFQIRACSDSEGSNCGDWQTGTLSQLTFPAGTILPPP